MKRILISLLVSIIAGVCFAEDFVAPEKKVNKAFTDTTTTHTYRIDDVKYNVYVSKNGAFYIWKISKKTNKPYKYYLPKDIQAKMGRTYASK